MFRLRRISDITLRSGDSLYYVRAEGQDRAEEMAQINLRISSMCRRRRKGSIRTLVDVVCGSALAPNRPLVTGPLTLEESRGSKYLATRIEPGGSGARARAAEIDGIGC